MDTTQMALAVALISALGLIIVLIKHIMFKRELMELKEDMKRHQLVNGFDDELWYMFVERTRKMLRFKR